LGLTVLSSNTIGSRGLQSTAFGWCKMAFLTSRGLTFAGCFFALSLAFANPAERAEPLTPGGDDNGGGLSTELIQAYHFNDLHKNDANWDLKQMIPTGLSSGQDASLAASQIADKSFQYWWNNSEIKQSSWGQSMDRAQKSLQQEVVLSEPVGSAAATKLNMGVDLFQTTARVKLEGRTNAEVYYQIKDSSTGVQVSRKLDRSKDLILGENLKSSDSTSEIKLRWNW